MSDELEAVEEQEVAQEESYPNPLSMSNEELEAYESGDELHVAQAETDEEEYHEEANEEEDVADAGLQEEEEEAGTAELNNELNKEDAYDQIMSEFKANGKMMSVDSVDEARQLMQMGANYNKKMSSMKPNLKLLKKLENNGLLDEGKLDYLIDLSKHDQGAISQLLKDSEIDPHDVDISDDSVYTPNTYKVDEKQMQLSEVIGQLKETDTYATMIDVVGNKWDETSGNYLADNPEDLVALNEHVANGTFSIVNTQVEKERMLGNLSGVSDLDAYKRVGQAMQTKGLFNKPRVNTQQVVQPSRAKTDPSIDKKRAAAPVRSKASTKTPKSYKNPLSMSNEEFEAAFGSEF